MGLPFSPASIEATSSNPPPPGVGTNKSKRDEVIFERRNLEVRLEEVDTFGISQYIGNIDEEDEGEVRIDLNRFVSNEMSHA